MKKTITIKKVGINGEGIGYLDRKIVFVPGAIPGEEVVVDINKRNKGYSEGKLLKVLQPSPNRIKAPCHMYENCQGCNLMHMNYQSQLQVKKDAILESLKKYTEYNVSKKMFLGVSGAKETEGYVTSVNLPVVTFNEQLTFGIYQRKSKYLTLMTRCIKHHRMINQCLVKIEKILNQNKCKSYDDKAKTGLRFLKMKLIDGKIQVVFITGRDGLKENIVNQISQIDEIAGIFMSVNTSRYQNFDESGYTKLYGSTRLEMIHDQKKYLIGIKSKLPENQGMIWQENRVVTKMVENSQKIISLNCGVGFLELNLDQEDVVAIDAKNYHIEDAKLNAKYLDRSNVKFVCGHVDDKVVSYAKKKTYDTLIIHGDRLKLSDRLIDTIKIAKFKNVIYISQSHSSLAKDLAKLDKNYVIDQIAGLDSSCHNTYMTTIVKLIRKSK